MNKYFDKNIKIYDLVQKYPIALDFLIKNGFTPLKSPIMLKSMGKVTSLEKACAMKNLNYNVMEQNLISLIENNDFSNDVTLLKTQEELKGDFILKGVLPCPIRVPLLESIHDFKSSTSLDFAFDLRAASMGVDWLSDDILKREEKDMPDAILSVGFKLFFDKEVMDKLFKSGLYSIVGQDINSDFKNDYIDLTDEKHRYHVLSVVPCVFLVNEAILGDRKCDSWEDLLSEDMQNSLSIPMGDLDMFNAICVSIYKKYGMDGIKKLARANKASLHPSQMVKSNNMKSSAPAVNIIPYFFANMAAARPNMKVVWPKDGAIISPIFLVVKTSKAQKAEEVMQFLHSDTISSILSANGKFPVTRKGIDNHLNDDMKFMWAGWDFINSSDIPKIISDCENVFNEVEASK